MLEKVGSIEFKNLTGESIDKLNQEYIDQIVNGFNEILMRANEKQKEVLAKGDDLSKIDNYKSKYNFGFWKAYNDFKWNKKKKYFNQE